MHTFWLVLTYDLLEDRHIGDNSARFKFDRCVILWTNHNSLLSRATNQFSSFCIDNRLHQSAIFVCVKVVKYEIKRLFFPYILILYYIKQIDSMLPCICSLTDHRGRQKCGKNKKVAQNISDTLSCASCTTFLFLPHFDVICDLLLNRCTVTWNLFVKWFILHLFSNSTFTGLSNHTQ